MNPSQRNELILCASSCSVLPIWTAAASSRDLGRDGAIVLGLDDDSAVTAVCWQIGGRSSFQQVWAAARCSYFDGAAGRTFAAWARAHAGSPTPWGEERRLARARTGPPSVDTSRFATRCDPGQAQARQCTHRLIAAAIDHAPLLAAAASGPGRPLPLSVVIGEATSRAAHRRTRGYGRRRRRGTFRPL